MPLRTTATLATGTTQSHDVAGLDCGTTYLFAVKGRGDGSTYSRQWGTYSYINRSTSNCITSTHTPTPTHTPTVTSSEQIELLDLGGSFPDVFRVRASNLVSSSSYTLRTGVDNNNFALVVACTIRSDAPELSDTTYYPGFPIWAVSKLKGQSKRDGGIIVRSCKASQTPVYPIRDAILAVNHASCPSLSSSAPRQWGETALKTSRLPGALSLLARSWLYPPSAGRRR